MGSAERADVTIVRVPPRDIGRNGQMFLASYIAEAETALFNFWRSRPFIDSEPTYIASKASCSLHRPLHLDELAAFTVRVSKIGGKSVGFMIAVETDGELAAEVEIVWQAVHGDEHEPVALPEDTRDWLYTYLE